MVIATGSWRRGAGWLAAGVVGVLVAAGCSSPDGDGTADAVRSERTDVAFKDCGSACAGELDGAKYAVRLPQKWNGTLLLYSHGYRQAKPAPPDFAPVSTEPAPAPTDEVATTLLSQGYALAGSAYKSNGWAVADGVAAGEQLHDWFTKNVGTPDRTYVWGDSLGGLITELLAEKHPEWVAGSAPMCGVLGGTNLNFDLALDLAFAVKTLVYPQFKISGYSSYEEAVANFQGAYKAVLAATRSTGTGVPKLLLVGALTDAPTQTGTYDGSTLQSQAAALVESLVTGLVFSTVVRWEVEQRVGGNPSGNAEAAYPGRVSAAERQLIETVGPGSTDRNLALLASAAKTAPDQAARTEFAALGTPTGDLTVPTITVHTRADPLVLVQNETVFGARVAGAADRKGDLVQLFTAAPATYPKPAPYGAGHCNFTADERVGTVKLLDDWVRRGTYPAPPAATAAFGSDTGLSLGYRPGPWPAAAGS
jgi:pimeloyl-ACP methyl ester carboxylesterase